MVIRFALYPRLKPDGFRFFSVTRFFVVSVKWADRWRSWSVGVHYCKKFYRIDPDTDRLRCYRAWAPGV